MRGERPRVLVYRDHLLPISETFVLNQSLHLLRYEAHFIGSRIHEGPRIDIPGDRRHVINRGGPTGKLQEVAFKLLGRLPHDTVEWAKSLNASLVHAHFAPDGVLALPLARKLDLPLVVSLLGSDITFPDEQIWRQSRIATKLYLLRRRLLFKYASAFVVPSEFLRSKAIERGFPGHKVHLIRHGVDLEFFRPNRTETEWGNVLYVGRLIELKGLHFLIKAIARVRRQFPDVSLTVIGDGPQRAEFEALAREELGTKFVFMGAQPQSVVRDHMSRAYLFSMPSVTMPTGQTEAFGLVFVEAQAMGLPVVAFSSGGIPEIVVNGETGFLVPERSVSGLAEHIATLLAEPQLRNRMGYAGRVRVERFFDLRKQNTELEGLYEATLGTKVRLSPNDMAQQATR